MSIATIKSRYILHEKIGQGGMGIVYRATDRLTSDTVALKQVTVPGEHLQFGASTQYDERFDFRRALAQEFKTLASLRHPNIISVRDYGFDSLASENGAPQPYYTMNWLDNARNILDAGQNQPLVVQLDLLIQMLRALAYLHRRGIIHCDLKPDNVLVTNGRVKVLDFGLAVAHEHWSEGIVGTLAYMAPEVLQGMPISERSDLYALGVIAYELLSQQYPYDTPHSTGDLATDILRITPDVWEIDLDEHLAETLERLLEKSPEMRYADANQVIYSIAHAMGRADLARETAAGRESFLQAAKFVGRETEFGQLAQALQDAIAGQGSAWLIGGESGVGKSRLFDEVRTQALIDGALVLRGQAIREGSASYQMWRHIFRYLCLHIDLSDSEASVLKSLVPDIDTLIGRRVAPAPALSPKSMQERLLHTFSSILRRYDQLLVILLEDLQWARNESLLMFKRIIQVASQKALLIVGNYRHNERPTLPDDIPDARHLLLARLNDESIAELSMSMLGQVGQRPELLELLQRETEGNTFFIIEVVRALAQEAGQLDRIGQIDLPEQVFTESAQAVVARHLAQVPADAHPLLLRAAVAGRQLDLRVLQTLAPQQALDAWLSTCAEAFVLEVQDNQWRFAHDKLREGMLAALDDNQRAQIHRQVAEAIEAVHHDDPHYATALAEHYQYAGNTVKGSYYARIAGEQALNTSNLHQARHWLEHALSLSNSEHEKMSLHRSLGTTFTMLGNYELAQQHGEQSLAIANYLDDLNGRAAAHEELSKIHAKNYIFPLTTLHGEQSLMLWRELGEKRGIAAAMEYLGIAKFMQGDISAGYPYIEQSLALFREINHQPGIGNCLLDLGVMSYLLKDYATAADYFEQSLVIRKTINDREEIATNLSNLGIVSHAQGDHILAQSYFDESLAISRDIGAELSIANTLLEVAANHLKLEQYDRTRQSIREAIQIIHKLDKHSNFMGQCLLIWANLLLIEGQPDESAEFIGLAIHNTSTANSEEARQRFISPLLDTLAPVLGEEALQTAQARGAERDLNAVIAQILATADS